MKAPETENKQPEVKNALCFRSHTRRCSIASSMMPVKICGIENENSSYKNYQIANELLSIRCRFDQHETDGN